MLATVCKLVRINWQSCGNGQTREYYSSIYAPKWNLVEYQIGKKSYPSYRNSYLFAYRDEGSACDAFWNVAGAIKVLVCKAEILEATPPSMPLEIPNCVAWPDFAIQEYWDRLQEQSFDCYSYKDKLYREGYFFSERFVLCKWVMPTEEIDPAKYPLKGKE